MVFEKVVFYWLICLAIIAVLVGLLRLLITLSGARRRSRGFAGLHRDQQGSVQSLSFVMTLPFFIMIMMGIVQIGQIMLAKVVVEYAALASARAASVWVSQYTFTESGDIEQRNCIGGISHSMSSSSTSGIPNDDSLTDQDDESGNISEDAHVMQLQFVNNVIPQEDQIVYAIQILPDGTIVCGETDGGGLGGGGLGGGTGGGGLEATGTARNSSKINRIAMAAQLACLPICPSRWPYSGEPHLSPVTKQTHESLVKAYTAMAGDKSTAPNEAISKRIKNKLAYSRGNTKVEIEMEHPESDPPFQQYNYAYQVNPTYKLGENKGGTFISTKSLPACPGSSPGINCDPKIYYGPAYVGEAQAFQPSEVGWQDRITVTVRHHLALLPGPGKLLSKMLYGKEGVRSIGEMVGQQQGNKGEQDETLYTWPLVAKASTINEGELSILRYEQFFILEQ